jgi:hypothetical protein
VNLFTKQGIFIGGRRGEPYELGWRWSRLC